MKKSALKLAIAAAAFASAGVMAANDGLLGSTSTGDVLVQVSKGSVVQISGLADLTLGNFNDVTLALAGGASASDNACVYSSVTNYHATLSSQNGAAYSAGIATCSDPAIVGNPILCEAGDTGYAPAVPTAGTFIMTDGGLGAISYTASFNGAAADGSAQGPYVGNSIDTTCAGGTNSIVRADIAGNAMLGQPDGNYTDTLYIMISPN